MTRTDVTVENTEVLDVFHDYDRNGDPVEVEVAGSATIGYSGEAGSITLRGYECDLDEHAEKYGDLEYGRTFEVRLNGEIVAEGLLYERTHAAAVVEAGGALINVPPNQHVEIDVYGEEASND